MPPQPILKALPKIFAHSDKTIRAEGSALAQSLYQCIGAAIEPFLGDLKPVQVKESNESFEKCMQMDKERVLLKRNVIRKQLLARWKQGEMQLRMKCQKVRSPYNPSNVDHEPNGCRRDGNARSTSVRGRD